MNRRFLRVLLSGHLWLALIGLACTLIIAVGPHTFRENLSVLAGVTFGLGLGVQIYQSVHRIRMTEFFHHHLAILAELSRSGLVDEKELREWLDDAMSDAVNDARGADDD